MSHPRRRSPCREFLPELYESPRRHSPCQKLLPEHLWVTLAGILLPSYACRRTLVCRVGSCLQDWFWLHVFSSFQHYLDVCALCCCLHNVTLVLDETIYRVIGSTSLTHISHDSSLAQILVGSVLTQLMFQQYYSEVTFPTVYGDQNTDFISPMV